MDEKKLFPPPASLEYVEGKLFSEYGFRVEGVGLASVAFWYEHEERWFVDPEKKRYVTVTHLVYPRLNIHVICERVRYGSEGKYEEYIRIEPWVGVVIENE